MAMNQDRPSKIKDVDFLILYNWKGDNTLYFCQVSAPTRDQAKRRFLASINFSQKGKIVKRAVAVRQILAPGEPIYIPITN